MAVNPNRLYAALLNTGLQTKDNATYQVIYQLIGAVAALLASSSASSSGSSTINSTNQQLLMGENSGTDGNQLIIPGPQGIKGDKGADAPYLIPDSPDNNLFLIPGPIGLPGKDGSTIPGLDGLDGEDGLTPCCETNSLGAFAYQNTAQTLIAVNVVTLLTYDAERYDNGVFHDNTTNPGRLTIPVSGKYIFNCNAAPVGPAAVAPIVFYLLIYINGTGTLLALGCFAIDAGFNSGCSVTGIYNFVAGDYIESKGLYLAGAGTWNQTAGVTSNFSIERLGNEQ
jgi:hypothetical protein